MSPILTARISEGMKSEIEVLVEDTGLWGSRSDFVKEAIDEQIKRYWKGDRFAQRAISTENNER